MSAVRRLAAVLCVIGAVNWGLVAIAEFDLVAEVFGMEFGETNAATRIIYGLVGIAGVVLLVTEFAGARQPAGQREHATLR
jgi:uncharacterized membrane protein YuzA (DUF378 family)